jgi:hypothetical protein
VEPPSGLIENAAAFFSGWLFKRKGNFLIRFKDTYAKQRYCYLVQGQKLKGSKT